MTNEQYFNESVKRIGLDPAEFYSSKFRTYLELLEAWSKKINLTSILEDREIIVKHFVDSLTVLDMLETESNVIDIGTGAGFPGIPLKIFEPSLKITLMDSSNKKIIFLKEVGRRLNLADIKILCQRAEDIGEDLKSSYDFVLFRAVGDTNKLLSLSQPYLKPGGKAVVMKSAGEKNVDIPKYFNFYFKKELNLPFAGDFRSIYIYQLTGDNFL